MDKGSLSIFIVALESRVTHPKEPVISKGGCRDYGPVTGNTPGTRIRISVSYEK